MRPIKYRAWHFAVQRMYNVHRIEFDRNTQEVIAIELYDPIRHTSLSTEEVFQIELMQYTGLLDKNGKKIFEGDIVAIKDATAKVIFWERPPEFGLDFYHNEYKWCEDWNLTDDSNRMEVIGNVHEHPSLLGTTEKPKRAK